MSSKPVGDWLDSVRSYCEVGGTLAITDDQIRSAVEFEGWRPDYLTWGDEHWENRAAGIPSLDVGKNAYHIRYLAEKMQENRAWIGRDLRVLQSGYIEEGHHRVRAAKYLRANFGILIPEPERIGIFLQGDDETDRTKEIIFGRCSTLPLADRLVQTIRSRVSGRITDWLQSPNDAIAGERPMTLALSGDFASLFRILEA